MQNVINRFWNKETEMKTFQVPTVWRLEDFLCTRVQRALLRVPLRGRGPLRTKDAPSRSHLRQRSRRETHHENHASRAGDVSLGLHSEPEGGKDNEVEGKKSQEGMAFQIFHWYISPFIGLLLSTFLLILSILFMKTFLKKIFRWPFFYFFKN